MEIFQAGFDNGRYKSKPSGLRFDSMKSQIAETIRRVKRDQLKSFVSFIGQEGCTFSPATFKTSFSSIEVSRNTFLQMQLFVLDFNDSISLEEVMNRAGQYELSILFAYETLGSKNQSRFRVIFLNDISVKYVEVAEIMMDALLTIFPEADARSRDITQFYFGGRRLLYFDETAQMINIECLFRNMCLYLKERYGDKNYRRYIYDFSSRTGLALTEKKYFDISVYYSAHRSIETLSPNSILYIIENGDKSSEGNCNVSKLSYGVKVNRSTNHSTIQSSRGEILSANKTSSKVHLSNRSSALRQMDYQCRLFKEFNDGTRILDKNELNGLSTTLIQIESGSNKFIDVLKKHSYFDDNPIAYSRWDFRLNYMKKSDYDSCPCVTFCPYQSQCHHARYILSTIKPSYHTTTKLANYNEEFYSIEEAEDSFKQAFYKAMEAEFVLHREHIHVIDAPTAIGKSTMILDYMEKHPDKNFLIADPTNELKNTNYDKAVARGIHADKSPSLLEYKDKMPSNIWNHIQNLYQAGKYHHVMEYIKEVISERNTDAVCRHILQDHLQDMNRFFFSKNNMFTTHSMVAAMSQWVLQKYDAVIFDEDPLLLYTAANQVKAPVSELVKVLDEIAPDSQLAKKIKAATEAAASDSWVTLPSIPYEEAYSSISTAIDIPSFCLAQKLYLKEKADGGTSYKHDYEEDSFVFLKQLKLNPRIKYIILSATASPKVYNYAFRSRNIVYYECKKAKYIGTLKQYTQHTMSRSFMKNHPDLVRKMIKLGGTDNVITFKDEEFGIDECHFGKTTGIDILKGKDLTILGTYHRPEWLYKLFLFTLLGASSDKYFDDYKGAVQRYQPIHRVGFGAHFMTYDESVSMLRDIQLWMVESELEQAVGRARLPRYDCTVTLFSNFPLRQAVLMDADLDKD